MSTDVHLIAVVKGKPGSAEAIKAAIKPCVEATRQEEGCLKYDLHQDSARPDQFYFVEHWASQESLDQHGRSAHIKALENALAPLIAHPLEVSPLAKVF